MHKLKLDVASDSYSSISLQYTVRTIVYNTVLNFDLIQKCYCNVAVMASELKFFFIESNSCFLIIIT